MTPRPPPSVPPASALDVPPDPPADPGVGSSGSGGQYFPLKVSHSRMRSIPGAPGPHLWGSLGWTMRRQIFPTAMMKIWAARPDPPPPPPGPVPDWAESLDHMLSDEENADSTEGAPRVCRRRNRGDSVQAFPRSCPAAETGMALESERRGEKLQETMGRCGRRAVSLSQKGGPQGEVDQGA